MTNFQDTRIKNLIADQIRDARLQAEVQRRIAMIAELGDDIYVDGDVLTFAKRFTADADATTYTYAALKAAGRWYLTGSTFGRCGTSWDELVIWLVSEGEPTTVLTHLNGVR